MSYREEVEQLRTPLSSEEKRVEMLAMFLVNEFHLLPSNMDIGRFSGGHKWGRATTDERNTFREMARRMLEVL